MPSIRKPNIPTARDSRVKRSFRITGRVQGVYFRHSTRVEAERLGLVGVARNLSDGSVEVVAHGPPAALETLRQWLQRGPSQAQVTAVQDLPDDGERSGETVPGIFSVE